MQSLHTTKKLNLSDVLYLKVRVTNKSLQIIFIALRYDLNVKLNIFEK